MRPPAIHFGTLAQPLDEVLGTTSRVRVLRTLDRSAEPLAPATLAKRTGLTYHAVLGALEPLEQSGLVTATPVGGTRVFALATDHPFRAALQQLFSAERARRRAIPAAVEKWAHAQPETLLAVWLFGSVARREDTFQSDIDIALVADDVKEAKYYADSLHDALAPVATRERLRPGVIPYGRREIEAMPKSDHAMWGNLTRDAIPLYGPDPESLQKQLATRRRRPASPRARSPR